MMIFVIFVALLITLDFAALIWGFDSRDGMYSEDGLISHFHRIGPNRLVHA